MDSTDAAPPKETLELCKQALASLALRKDEDINEWAEKLARAVVPDAKPGEKKHLLSGYVDAQGWPQPGAPPSSDAAQPTEIADHLREIANRPGPHYLAVDDYDRKMLRDAADRIDAHPEDAPGDDPFAHLPPTDADEPPWKGWFSCEDCNGWFCGQPTCYENGVEVCPSCADKRAEDAPGGPTGFFRDLTIRDQRGYCWFVRFPGEHRDGPYLEETACLIYQQEKERRDALNSLEGDET